MHPQTPQVRLVKTCLRPSFVDPGNFGMYLAAATRAPLGSITDQVREGHPPDIRGPVSGSRFQSPMLEQDQISHVRLTTQYGLPRAACKEPLSAIDELSSRILALAAPKETTYRPRKPHLEAINGKNLYDDRPMVFSPAHARRSMAPSQRGPGSLHVSMPTTKPLPNHDLDPLMMPTNSSFFRTLETSRSLSMITTPGTTRRRSPFGRAIYTPNSDLVREGVPASPHHGVGLRATVFHRS